MLAQFGTFFFAEQLPLFRMISCSSIHREYHPKLIATDIRFDSIFSKKILLDLSHLVLHSMESLYQFSKSECSDECFSFLIFVSLGMYEL